MEQREGCVSVFPPAAASSVIRYGKDTATNEDKLTIKLARKKQNIAANHDLVRHGQQNGRAPEVAIGNRD
jgi:hypothetical protein